MHLGLICVRHEPLPFYRLRRQTLADGTVQAIVPAILQEMRNREQGTSLGISVGRSGKKIAFLPPWIDVRAARKRPG